MSFFKRLKRKAKELPKEFSFEETKSLPKCKEIADVLVNPALENLPIYIVDEKGNHVRIKEIGFGKHFGGVEIRL